MWMSLKPVTLLLVVGVGLSLGSELGSANVDDIDANEEDRSIQEEDEELSVEVEKESVEGSGSGEAVGVELSDLGSDDVASTAILPNGITNSSKEAVIDEYIIVSKEEGNKDLEVENEEESVDGSGSGDHDDLFQSEMFDDVGSGQSQAIHEKEYGSGSGAGPEDENDLGSIEVIENIGGDVVNGYRIMGVSSNQVVHDDSVDESLVENDDISLEVNVEAVATSDLPLDVTEAAVTSEAPKVETSSPKPAMEDGGDAASEYIEIDDSRVDKSNLLEKKKSEKEEKKKSEDDLGFLGMIASKRAKDYYDYDYDFMVTETPMLFSHDDHDEYAIDYDFMVTESPVLTSHDDYDYDDHDDDDYSIDLANFDFDETDFIGFENEKRKLPEAPRRVMRKEMNQGHKHGVANSLFISVVIVCIFL